jgi:hypothetical protein
MWREVKKATGGKRTARNTSISVAHESRTRNEKLDGFEFFT